MELKAVFEEMARRFKAGKFPARKSFYFTLGDRAEQKFTVWVGPDGMEVKPGKAIEQADCVLKTSEDFFVKMVIDGYVPGAMDFFRGKVKTNDVGLLQAFGESFPQR